MEESVTSVGNDIGSPMSFLPVNMEGLLDTSVTVTLNTGTAKVLCLPSLSESKINGDQSRVIESSSKYERKVIVSDPEVKFEPTVSQKYFETLDTVMTRSTGPGPQTSVIKFCRSTTQPQAQLPPCSSSLSIPNLEPAFLRSNVSSETISVPDHDVDDPLETTLQTRTTEYTGRVMAILQRLQAVRDDAIETHARQQVCGLIRETGMEPPIEDKFHSTQEEGRRRKSVSVSTSGTTYGNDDGGACLNLKSPPSKPAVSVTTLSQVDVTNLQRLASLLSTVMDERNNFPRSPDSEETESSSEDGSDDENESLSLSFPREPETIYNYLPVEENPKTKWANDRAELICMWNWIRDALANVTHQISRQDEMYKHILLSKTPIQFEQAALRQPPLEHHSVCSSDLKDAVVQVYNAEGGTPITYFNANNKINSSSPSSSKDLNAGVGEDRERDRIKIGGGLGKLNIDFGTTTEEGCQAARTLPLDRLTLKKRKIYNVGRFRNMASQAKACSCFGKVELCPLCLSRCNKTKLVDPDVMSGREIVSHLDYCSHESLSLRSETRFDLLVDSSLKLGTWKKSKERRRYNFLSCTYNRPVSPGHGQEIKHPDISVTDDPEKVEKRGRGRPRLLSDKSKLEETKKKYANSRKLARMQRGGYGGRVKPLIARRQFKKRKYPTSFSKYKDEDNYGGDDFEPMTGDLEEEYSWRPPTQPGKLKRERSTNSSSEQYKRSRRDQDFDIDNIVIPYSIASATRVEKIEYKEIITPSWRSVQEDTDELEVGTGTGSGSDVEDMSELTIAARHDRSEVEEHKKFSIRPLSSRRGRRTDSKTESFNFDTPDAMSPLMSDVNTPGGDTLPPSPTAEDQNLNLSMTAAEASLALTALKLSTATMSRRRTTSSSKKDEEVYVEEEEGYIPFEPRQFPLTQEDYDFMLTEMPDDFLLSPPKPDQSTTTDTFVKIDTESGLELPTRSSPSRSDKDDDGSSEAGDDPDWEFIEGDR